MCESNGMLTALVLRYLRPYRRPVAAVVKLQSITTLAALYLPTLNAAIIDDGVTVGNTAVIVRLGAVMLAISGLAVACSVGAVFFGSRAAMGFGRDLRAAVFDRVTEFSLAETTRLGPATLLTRTTNDVGQIQALAGCDLLTISPDLLATLAQSDAALPRMLDPAAAQELDLPPVQHDEASFRFALNEDAMATEKLAEGIRAFCADAVKLEKLLLAA